MRNTLRLTVLSFLAYFVMSGMLAPWGVISGSVADFFGTTETDVTERFGWLTGGNLLGAILALTVYHRFGIRALMLTLYALILASVVSLLLAKDLQSIQVAFGVIGTCCGVGLAGAALTISLTYQAERRASMLVITDGCFSIAGYLCSAIAVLFVSWALHWSMTYQVVGFVALVIVLLSAFSIFPQANPTDSKGGHGWPVTAWLCIGGLFLYTL
ncbi:MAG: MFS transporter TsgA, partial [Pseudomonadota bacterium]